jgi:hypothetical protein
LRRGAGSRAADRLPPAKLGALPTLLEVMIEDDEPEEFSDEDRRAVAASREYFRQGGEGLSFEEVVADCGFTMEQIRANLKTD